jgi:hypothetical protein
VLVFVDAPDCERCREYVRGLLARRADIGSWGGCIGVVVRGALPGEARTMSPGMEALLRELGDADVALLAASEHTTEGAALVVADEWGEIHFAAESARHELPAPDEVVDWVRFVAIQCPECEGPEGEWKTLVR